MEHSLFDRITVNQDELSNPLFWLLQSQLTITESRYGLGKLSMGVVQAGVFEIDATIPRPPETWNQAGWLNVYSAQQFCFSQWLPLGKSFIFLPPERTEYEVFFTPVRWLFNCSVELKQFSGEWSERLRNLEAQVAAIESPQEIVLEVLAGPGSPLAEIQEQLDNLPNQVSETIEVLLDAGETP